MMTMKTMVIDELIETQRLGMAKVLQVSQPMSWLKCCFTSTETIGSLGTGALDVHLLTSEPDL